MEKNINNTFYSKEILFLNKGDVIWVCKEIPYMVTNKHIDYLNKITTVYTKSVY